MKNVEPDTDKRGFRAWYRVTKDYRGMSTQRLIGLVETVYAPTRTPDFSELSSTIVAWEMTLDEYERHTG